MSGWIKIHRKIIEWEWADDSNVMCLWMHILCRANFEPSRYKGFDIPIGSLVYGHEAFSSHTGLTVMQTRTALKKLEKSKNITIKRTNKFSIISITKWSEYQEDNRQVTDKQQASNRQVTAYKEYKNKERKNIYNPENVSLDVWEDFVNHRKAKKSPITKTAMTRIENEAQKIGWTFQQAIEEMLNRGWTGFKAEWIDNIARVKADTSGLQEWQTKIINLVGHERAHVFKKCTFDGKTLHTGSKALAEQVKKNYEGKIIQALGEVEIKA